MNTYGLQLLVTHPTSGNAYYMQNATKHVSAISKQVRLADLDTYLAEHLQ
jgi:hypothetical protein